MNTQPAVCWNRLRCVVFDVDGTLYDQRYVRSKMLLEMLTSGKSFDHVVDMRIIHFFRRSRERLARLGASDVAYEQFACVADALGVSFERVSAVIHEWMELRPIKYIRAARRDGVVELFQMLRARSVQIGILSDYPAAAKLAAMELQADAVCCSTEVEINRLKPDPTGLRVLLRRLGREPQESIMIGDRYDHDGVCAAAVGLPFLRCDSANFFPKLAQTWASGATARVHG